MFFIDDFLNCLTQAKPLVLFLNYLLLCYKCFCYFPNSISLSGYFFAEKMGMFVSINILFTHTHTHFLGSSFLYILLSLSFSVHSLYWYELDGSTGSNKLEDCIMLQCLFWQVNALCNANRFTGCTSLKRFFFCGTRNLKD